MSERSDGPAPLEAIEAHARALFELMPKSPPPWAHHDLTFGQLRLLFTLGQAGPVSIGRLAGKLGVTDATASEFVDRLERRGLALRNHRVDDRRVVECRLSDEGAALIGDIQGARQDAMRNVFALLTTDELAQFDRLIQIVVERLSATPTTVVDTGGSFVKAERPTTWPASGAGRRA